MRNAKRISPRSRLVSRSLAAGIVAAVLSLIAAASSSAAVEEKLDVTHLFNAAHSLTGNCSKAAPDPVKDPACEEEPQGPLPPEGRLVEPVGVAVDAYGDQYVVNHNTSKFPGSHIDIFDPTGHYIGGLTSFTASSSGVGGVAVDSTGHLYIAPNLGGEPIVVRYDPVVYHPEAGEIEYGPAPVTVLKAEPGASGGIAVDPATDRLYVSLNGEIRSYGPAVDGVPNAELDDSIGSDSLKTGNPPGRIAIDGGRKRIYVVDWETDDHGPVLVKVLSSEPPYQLLATFDGSTTPVGDFTGEGRSALALAVDEASGNLFVNFLRRVYELEPDGTYVATVREPVQDNNLGFTQIAYDNGPLSPNPGYLYIPTGIAQGHLYAYEPKAVALEPPAVESISFDRVTHDEAVLHATVNPSGQPTDYAFELTTQQDFEENGFANAERLGEGKIGVSGEGVAVSAAAGGLDPGTPYRFRVVAENECEPGGCAVEAQRRGFATFPLYAHDGACANEALRTGASARLPDCRAYELVSPASTGGRGPGFPGQNGPGFATWAASPEGDSVVFRGYGGTYPDFEQSGGYNGDPYVSRRSASGWTTEGVGLSGRQAGAQNTGGFSADHGFTAVAAFSLGNLETELANTQGDVINYTRYPDGSFHLTGGGSIGEAERVITHYISRGGSHSLFSVQVQLEPGAPANGTSAIYDRTSDGTLHVASLLPGGVTPMAGLNANLRGFSTDGSTIAFQFGVGGNPLFLRLDDAETVEAAPMALSGRPVTCDAGSGLAGATPAYEWLLEGSPIPGATASTYTPLPSQAGMALQCVVRAVNSNGGSLAASVPLTIDEPRQAGIPPRPAGEVFINPSELAVGVTTGCKTSLWSPTPSFSFQWYRDGSAIPGATASSYEVQAADAGTVLQCGITAAANGMTTLAFSTAKVVGSPGSSGKPSAGASTGAPTFAGLSEDGHYLFYLFNGDLYRFDSRSAVTERLTETGDVIPAYVAAEGTSAYFVSEAVIGAGVNPRGAEPQAGKPNLYQWDEGTVRFVATVTGSDVEGEVVPAPGLSGPVLGFREWLNGIDSSGRLQLRATAGGQTLLFASRADLASFESGGKKQIYRYDAGEGTLICLSCDPTLNTPKTDATLLSDGTISSFKGIQGVPLQALAIVANLSSDGQRAFFESEERLVPSDEDGLRDVYEWEAEGKGSCAQPGGCLSLISSGQSARNDYLYGASESGEDVFVYTADLLTAEDAEEAPSIYDARVGGGFPPPRALPAECQGEACQPVAVAPDRLTPASSSFAGKGNVGPETTTPPRCRKGQRKVRRAGKARCVSRHPHKQKRDNAKRRSGR